MYVQLNYSIYTTGQLMKNYFKFISEKKNPTNYLIKYRLFKILHFITKQLQFIFITHHFLFWRDRKLEVKDPQTHVSFSAIFLTTIFNFQCFLQPFREQYNFPKSFCKRLSSTNISICLQCYSKYLIFLQIRKKIEICFLG